LLVIKLAAFKPGWWSTSKNSSAPPPMTWCLARHHNTPWLLGFGLWWGIGTEMRGRGVCRDTVVKSWSINPFTRGLLQRRWGVLDVPL
jgi:hypothetical protein